MNGNDYQHEVNMENIEKFGRLEGLIIDNKYRPIVIMTAVIGVMVVSWAAGAKLHSVAFDEIEALTERVELLEATP
jgi:hypothetical protein